MLDGATLLIASMAVQFVMALYFWTLWLGRRDQRVHLWIAASITAGVLGCGCYMLRGVAPEPLAMWAAQLCFVQVFAFLWGGVRLVHARPRPAWIVWSGAAVLSASCLIPALVAAEALRNVVATLAFSSYGLAMTGDLLRRRHARTAPTRWLTGGLLLLVAAASLAFAADAGRHSVAVASLVSIPSLPALWLLFHTTIYVTLVLSLTTLELGNEAQRQREAATTDSLTGLLNRRAFMERATPAAGHPRGATLLMLDIDHFKQVNDLWGHSAGDRALVLFAGALLDATGGVLGAFAARIGGEEFAVLLPGRSRDEAAALGLRIAARVRELRHTPGATRMTVSIGLAESGTAMATLDELLSGADRALYRAKRGGRDRLEQDSAPFAPSLAA